MAALTTTDLIVRSALALSLLLGLTSAVGYAFLQPGNIKGRICFAALLFLFSLAIFSNLLAGLGVFGHYWEKYFYPLWFTLSFGPLLFYFIKYTLYPTYSWRGSDTKHLILPAFQAGLYIYWFFCSDRQGVWDAFIGPYYKTVEGGLFVGSFFTYLALGYRYIKFKQATARKNGFAWELEKTIWLQFALKVLLLLGALNTFYIVADFTAYLVFGVNLGYEAGFSQLAEISFACLLLWLCFEAWHKIRGEAYLHPRTPSEGPLFERLDRAVHAEKLYLDPDLGARQLARYLGTSRREMLEALREQGFASLAAYLAPLRLQTARDRLGDPKYRTWSFEAIAYSAGFERPADLKRIVK